MILAKPYRPRSCKRKFLSFLTGLFLLLGSVSSFAQNTDIFAYEEVYVNLHVPRIGNREIQAVIQGQTVFLSITEIFDFLEIRNSPSAYFDTLSGFFVHPLNKYLVDKRNNYIIYQDVVYNLQPNSLLRTEAGLFLQSNYFNEIFALDFQFNFRSLSISLNTKVELPAIRKMQQEAMRQNIRLLKKEIISDTTFKRTKGLLNIAMADWAVQSNGESNGSGNTRATLNIGGLIGGGEANAHLVYNTAGGFDRQQQYYRWRFVNNKAKLVKQITAGRIWAGSTSTIVNPLHGVQITNTPTTFRKSFGTYRLTRSTEPDWTVELYVNNILINYTKADASGFFSFDVPLVYGNSVVTLRAYGPYGEERVKEEQVSIPFNFLPYNEIEYGLSAGVVDDDHKSRFSRANVNYGFTRRITIGAGVEYLSSVDPANITPFVNASARIGSRIMVNAEHTNGVRSKGFLSYRLPSNLQLELNYIRYVPGQTAVRFNYEEERKATVSYLFRTKPFSGLTRLTINQVKLSKMQQTHADLMVSGTVAGVSTNLSTQVIYAPNTKPFINSNLSFTFRLPAGTRFTPQLRYDFGLKEVNSLRLEVEKRVLRRGFLNVAYQTVADQTGNIFSLGLRYNFSFAQLGASVRSNKQSTSTYQYASGSMLYDSKHKKLKLNYQSNVGRGALVVVPFIDINNNGKRDKGEPKAEGLKLNVRGGKVERDSKDTVVRITGLEAHTDYLVECEKASFDNISWRILKPNIQVTIEPNHFKLIEVPVVVVGEVTGTVYLDKGRNGKAGIGRMYVNIYKNDTTLVAKTLTEPDGYFSYLGLTPGKYTASIDTVQMAKLNFCCNDTRRFDITVSLEGDIVEGLDFVIISPSDTLNNVLDDKIEVQNEKEISEKKNQLKELPTNETNSFETKQPEVKSQIANNLTGQKPKMASQMESKAATETKVIKSNTKNLIQENRNNNVAKQQILKEGFQTQSKHAGVQNKKLAVGTNKLPVTQRTTSSSTSKKQDSNIKKVLAPNQKLLRGASPSQKQQIQPTPLIMELRKLLNIVEELVVNVAELILPLPPQQNQVKSPVKKR